MQQIYESIISPILVITTQIPMVYFGFIGIAVVALSALALQKSTLKQAQPEE